MATAGAVEPEVPRGAAGADASAVAAGDAVGEGWVTAGDGGAVLAVEVVLGDDEAGDLPTHVERLDTRALLEKMRQDVVEPIAFAVLNRRAEFSALLTLGVGVSFQRKGKPRVEL